MLKTIHIPGVGPYVCGRIKSEGQSFPPFTTSTTQQAFHDIDSIRDAAKSLKPIYAAVEDLLGNDKYGDCTCAAALKIQAILDCAAAHPEGGSFRLPKLSDALWLYGQVSGFNPATGKPDEGADLQTVLTHWQKYGLYEDGHGKIKTAHAVDGSKKSDVIAAMEANGVIYAGCDLPKAWENITGTGFTWPMDGAPDPEAGHCTFFYGYNETGVFDGTWGMEGTIPWDAVAYYFGGQTGELYTVVAA